MSAKMRFYVYTVIVAGAMVMAGALAQAHFSDPWRYAAYFVLAILASTFKLRLPGINGTYSLSFLFLLAGIEYFTLAETLLAGCAAGLVQSVVHARKRPTPPQILFNIANLVVSIAIAFALARQVIAGHAIPLPASLSLVAFVYFVVNTGLVSGVLCLVQDQPLRKTWEEWYEWSLPYYLVGAVIVGLIPVSGQLPGPASPLLLIPLLYLVHFFDSLKNRRTSAPAAGSQAGVPEHWPLAARICIATVLGGGFSMLGVAATHLEVRQSNRFLVYLAAAALASTLKIRLPGMTGTLSLGFVVTLAAIADLGFAEVVLIASAAALVQCFWRTQHRPRAVQVLYSISALALSSALAFAVCRVALAPMLDHSVTGIALFGTVLLYGSNTALISLVLGLIQRQPLSCMWRSCHFWSFPYYLVGAAAVSLMLASSQAAGWQPALLVLPTTVLVFVSYRLHVARAAKFAFA